MKNTKIKEIKPLVETKFVGLYEVSYKNKLGDDRTWTVASRKNKEELSEIYLNNKEGDIDAVVIAAFHKEYKKLILIKQFRVPINNYIYELPAGLVDNKEGMEKAVQRELKEETGLDIVKINKVKSKNKIYLSPGMTDESVAFVYCTCSGELSKEFLEEDEDIEPLLISQGDARRILSENEEIDIKAFLILQMFAEIGEKLFE
ncbi:NUDIX hydrolase [Romboutsia ilealis]|uniref:NUDIX hydrolase n=1 Tax=Romboutsia faecis TaxID=2764597 RepID=A0ABR7JNQ5_9FIRM|nr:NUDIX hydrolase [Romboutsia faecis]MBC5996566.1 NUDIX hydrolase [Romboutsia faecis]MRN24092.1 NUDIX hydrolase [Romboutsia ilealis]